jgi:hypothetical protein
MKFTRYTRKVCKKILLFTIRYSCLPSGVFLSPLSAAGSAPDLSNSFTTWGHNSNFSHPTALQQQQHPASPNKREGHRETGHRFQNGGGVLYSRQGCQLPTCLYGDYLPESSQHRQHSKFYFVEVFSSLEQFEGPN